MNRQDWERQVHGSNMNTTARCVALVVGSFGNWKDDRTVWPSTKAIADMAGMTRDTAQRYMDAFVEQGWLRLVKVREKNVKEYELLPAVASPLGILAKTKRTSNLPNRQATDTADEVSTTKQLPNRQEGSCLTEKNQLPNGEGPVASPLGTNLKEPTIKNLLEEPTRHTVPDGPVDMDTSLNDRFERIVSSLNFKEGTFPSLLNLEGCQVLNFKDRDAAETTEEEEEMGFTNLQRAEIGTAVVKAAKFTEDSHESKHWQSIKAKALDATFKPEITDPASRVGHAAASLAPTGGAW